MIIASDLAIKTRSICLVFAASALLAGCDISPEKHNSRTKTQVTSVDSSSTASKNASVVPLSRFIVGDTSYDR